MVSHMKTTVEISDPIFKAAKETARREDKTFRSLVEEGLRLCLEIRKEQPAKEPFRLRDASVDGRGLQRELQGASWDRIRNLAYGDREG